VNAQRRGGFDPVGGDLASRGPQPDLTAADGVVERVLDGVFRVWDRAGLHQWVVVVVGAGKFQRDEVIELS
jgi:hypothetical protein